MINKLKTHKITLMKERNESLRPEINILSLILTQIKNKAVSLKKLETDLTEQEIREVLKSVKKQLTQELESLERAGRDTIPVLKQLDLVSSYLPKQKTKEETVKILDKYLEEGMVIKDIMKSLAPIRDELDMKFVQEYLRGAK